LKDKSDIENFVSITKTIFDRFNFDMMKAMVEEMNRYGETSKQVLKYINARPQASVTSRYAVQVEALEKDNVIKEVQKHIFGNPLSGENVKVVYINKEGDTNTAYVEISSNTMKKFDFNTGVYAFENEGFRVNLSLEKKFDFDFIGSF
jgi:hypothetical protein